MSDAPGPHDVRATFADFILFHARSRPSKPAIILADRIATYGMLAQGMLQVEDRLRALVIPRGELVCVTLDNAVRHLIVAAACFRLGLPVISAASASDIFRLGLPIKLFLHGAGESMIPGLRQVLVGDDWFVGEARPIPAARAEGFANDETICRVDLSSGATGRPKAVSTTVGALYHRQTNCYTSIDAGVWTRQLILPGLSGAWGFVLATHALRAGGTLLKADSPREALEMIAAYGVDALAASAQQLRDLVVSHQKSPVPCHSLRVAFTCGGLLSSALAREARVRLCGLLINHYGSTEMGSTAVGVVDGLPEIEGATGYAIPGVDLEVVDEHGERLDADTEGLVRIRSPWGGRPFPPESANGRPGFRDGWFYPGDRGRLTPEGLLVLGGRASEVINSGGVKIAPELVEEVMLRHESVAEAAAFGAPGASGIEEINVAIVVRAPVAERAIVNWCRERKIEVSRVFIVEELPKTPMGKIRRNELKSRLVR
ncbi:MAG: fatty acid--CoA ligase family protein [Roseiarcus sp.]|jgi:acyl-coenzyme A synthetase/AMP-(fatty) acid ligase